MLPKSASQQKIVIYDSSLRDGNHAVKHRLSLEQIEQYLRDTEKSGIDVIEVGHGNGLGASTLQLGKTPMSDIELLECARASLSSAKLSVHCIPGYAKLDNINTAANIGIDIIRVASHCSEANVSPPYIEHAKALGLETYGVLMMSHMIDIKGMVEQAKILESAGANGVIIMDSAGTYLPADVAKRINALRENLSIKVGFHGHNNLGMAVANSLVATDQGATIIDGTICGFGAGAGNCPLEILISVLERSGYTTNCNIPDIFNLRTQAMNYLVDTIPIVKNENIITGMFGLFSGFERHIKEASDQFGVSFYELSEVLKERKLIAGQEDLIIDSALTLNQRRNEEVCYE